MKSVNSNTVNLDMESMFYPKENIDEMKQFFIKEIEDLFENKEIKYVI